MEQEGTEETEREDRTGGNEATPSSLLPLLPPVQIHSFPYCLLFSPAPSGKMKKEMEQEETEETEREHGTGGNRGNREGIAL